jgi:hypothetical protein
MTNSPDTTALASPHRHRRPRAAAPVRRAFRLLLPVLAVAMLGGVILVSAAPKAEAAHVCYNTGCDGKDPQSTGCAASAYTLAQRAIYDTQGNLIGYTQIRFSTHCQAQWTRTYELGANRCSVPTDCFDTAEISRWAQPGYPARTYGTAVKGHPSTWSYMVGARNAQAKSTGCIDLSSHHRCASVTG